MAPLEKIDRDRLARYRRAGLSVIEIAKLFDCSVSAVHRAITKADEAEQDIREAAASLKGKPDPAPPLRGPWSPDQDAKIIASKGKYAEIDKLARRWGKTTTQVLQRWHRLRGSA